MRNRTLLFLWFMSALFLISVVLSQECVRAQSQNVHLWISNHYLARVDSTVVVPQVLLDTLKHPIQYFSEDIEYDKSIVEFIDVTNGAKTPQPDWTVSKTVTTPGVVHVSAVSSGTPLLDSGEILRLIFHVVDTAIAFQATPIRDSAVDLGAGTVAISDTGMLRVYDACTPIVGQHGIPLTMSTECSPNPARDCVTITYSLPTSSPDVELRLLDASGTLVWARPLRSEDAGWHTVSIDLTGVPNGVYFYQVQANHSEQFRPIIVVH